MTDGTDRPDDGKRREGGVARAIFAAGALFTAALLALTAYWTRKAFLLAWKPVSVMGTVRDCITTEHPDGNTYYLTVDYAVPGSGRYTILGSGEREHCRQGARVEVVFCADDPELALIAPLWRYWLYSIFALAGAAVAGFLLFIFNPGGEGDPFLRFERLLGRLRGGGRRH